MEIFQEWVIPGCSEHKDTLSGWSEDLITNIHAYGKWWLLLKAGNLEGLSSVWSLLQTRAYSEPDT